METKVDLYKRRLTRWNISDTIAECLSIILFNMFPSADPLSLDNEEFYKRVLEAQKTLSALSDFEIKRANQYI